MPRHTPDANAALQPRQTACRRCGQILGGTNRTLHPAPCRPMPHPGLAALEARTHIVHYSPHACQWRRSEPVTAEQAATIVLALARLGIPAHAERLA